MDKIGIVVQRCPPGAAGGSESLAKLYADVLSESFDTEIITTTAVDAEKWTNALPPGVEEGKYRIRRFGVSCGRDPSWTTLHELLLRHFYAEKASNPSVLPSIKWPLPLQEEWIRLQGPHSKDLLEFLSQEERRYRAIVFFTYLFSPSYFGSYVTERKRTYLVPTLHDEPPAYLSAYRYLADRARKILWNTESEKTFGETLWGKRDGEVISTCLDIENADLTDEEIKRLIFKTTSPEILPVFVLYSGRIDAGKGCDHLIQYFLDFQKETHYNIHLVLTGTLSMALARHPRIHYAGFVGENEKIALMKRAACFIMPSLYESLSISTLEAMSQNTSVLVNGQNPVLREHLQKSEAGLSYIDYTTFKASLSRLVTDDNFQALCGRNGRNYIEKSFTRSAMKSRLFRALDLS